MSAQDQNRRESSSHVRVIAAAFLGFLLGSSYAIGTHMDNAAQQSTLAIPAVPAATEAPSYFPSQYVNQATELEAHIEAF